MTNTDNKRSRGNTGVLPADHTGRGARRRRGDWGPPRCHFGGESPGRSGAWSHRKGLARIPRPHGRRGPRPGPRAPGPSARDTRGHRGRRAGRAGPRGGGGRGPARTCLLASSKKTQLTGFAFSKCTGRSHSSR